MDRLELWYTMTNGYFVTLKDGHGAKVTGKIESIALEDGSGYCFNVRMYGHSAPFFVRCPKPV
jgi:hypothetical protein